MQLKEGAIPQLRAPSPDRRQLRASDTSAARSQEAAITGFVQRGAEGVAVRVGVGVLPRGRTDSGGRAGGEGQGITDGGSLGLNFTFDALSGSSPNGALPSHAPQTFASPSAKSYLGEHLYTTAPGNLPVDPDYSDRVWRSARIGRCHSPAFRVSRWAVRCPSEDDFYSGSVNVAVAHDFNDKNTTVSFGVNNEKRHHPADRQHPRPPQRLRLSRRRATRAKTASERCSA